MSGERWSVLGREFGEGHRIVTGSTGGTKSREVATPRVEELERGRLVFVCRDMDELRALLGTPAGSSRWRIPWKAARGTIRRVLLALSRRRR